MKQAFAGVAFEGVDPSFAPKLVNDTQESMKNPKDSRVFDHHDNDAHKGREGKNGDAYNAAIRKHIARSELEEGAGLKVGIIVTRGLTALKANLRVT